jgi:nitroreductase
VNDAYRAIARRRVTRRMTDRPLAPEDLDRVVRAARFAPNAGNRRLQPVTAVTDPPLVRRLRMVSPGMLPLPQAVLVISIDFARAAAYGFRPDAPGLLIDVGTTAATMLIAAEAVGIGACPVTSFSHAAVSRLLEADADVRPQMLICLGHPDADQPPAMRGAPVGGPAPAAPGSR